MASPGAAQAAGQSSGELRDLRERLLALAQTENELRAELKAARAQIAQLAQSEAMARSLLKESNSVTRALQERAQKETAAATAQLRESLEAERAERAKSQAELARATDELRARRNRPDAEMETLRALFADLMRGEAVGRQRLERLQKQVAEHERHRQELQQQLDLERDARQKAESQLLPAAPPPIPVVPAGDELRDQLAQLEMTVVELEKRHAALGGELAEERGKARAQAERAVAEVEQARDRAKAAAATEQEAKDALIELRKQFAPAQEKIREVTGERDRAAAQFAGQLAELRKKAATNLEEEKAVAAGLRDELGGLKSARDSAQEEARAVSLRERRTAAELVETQARATQLESQLDELRRALALRTESESAARAATELAEKKLNDVRAQLEESEAGRAAWEVAVANLEEDLHRASEEACAQRDDLVRQIEEERARLEAAKAEQVRLAAEGERLRASEAERGLTAERLAAELELARGEAKTLQGALDRNGVAIASLQARQSELGADLAKALHERDEKERSLAENAALLREERTRAEGRIAELDAALGQKDADLATERRARAEEVETMRAQHDAEQKRLAAELSDQTARAEGALRESQEMAARCETSKRELAEATERLRAAEADRGRTAKGLAAELELARGEAKTFQDALDRNCAALASMQARQSELESDLAKALRERDEKEKSLAEQAALLGEDQTLAQGRIADLEAALKKRDDELETERRARAEEVEAVRAQHDAEQKKLAAELSAETARAQGALRESEEMAARRETFKQELAEAAERMRVAEAEAAQAKAAQERQSAIARARREALIAELDGRFADAEALLQAELEQTPLEAPVFLQLGRLHYAWAEGTPGLHEDIAERLLTRAAELDPYDATATLYLGHVRMRRGRHAAATEAYGETVRRDDRCAPAHEALALLSARWMKRQARIAFAAAIALLLCSAGLLIHQFVQGPSARQASAFSESQARRAKNEFVPARRPDDR